MKELNIQQRSVGINFNKGNEAEILVWSPLSNIVKLYLEEKDQTIELSKTARGYWSAKTTSIQPEDLYHDNNYTGLVKDGI